MLSTAGSLISGGNLILSEKVMVQSAIPLNLWGLSMLNH